MRTIGLFEAKQKLSELVDQASDGHKIGITRRGKLTALIVPARPETSLREVFQDIERIRKRSKLSKRTRIKSLIEEGRS
jgi:prevent-host-death family protein